MLTTRNGLFTAALTGALAAQVPVFAAEQPWHVSGFLSQTLISTSENNFFGHTDDGLSPGYAEAGLLMAGKLSSALELSSQLLMRHAGELDDGRPRVDHLLVTYRLEDDFDRTQGLRVGRGKQHFGLYNETRDVPFTRPGILMPQSTYYDRARNTLLIADEISYFIDAREESGFYSFAIGIFRSLPDKTELTDYFAANNSIQTESGTGSGMQFTWRSPLEQWFIGITAG
ncbi:MAG TPA: hypothetical protein VFM46_19305, partial [Pseudomonadales bacterium]|nr:hypothetical protein [Pseudomonadales bacterium]